MSINVDAIAAIPNNLPSSSIDESSQDPVIKQCNELATKTLPSSRYQRYQPPRVSHKKPESLPPEITSLHKPLLPPPTRFSKLPPSLIVWRGCRMDQLIQMVTTKTAGGHLLDAKATAPTEEEAIAQVGEQTSLPEFTLDTSVAERFGRGQIVIACEIETKYLTPGSAAESGVVCKPCAPIKILGWKSGERRV